MRAFVKYKLLKKVIAKCTDRRKLKDPKESESEQDIEQLSEADKEKDAKAMAE